MFFINVDLLKAARWKSSRLWIIWHSTHCCWLADMVRWDFRGFQGDAGAFWHYIHDIRISLRHMLNILINRSETLLKNHTGTGCKRHINKMQSFMPVSGKNQMHMPLDNKVTGRKLFAVGMSCRTHLNCLGLKCFCVLSLALTFWRLFRNKQIGDIWISLQFYVNR